MTIFKEGGHAAAAVMSEGNSGISRDNLLIPAETTILPNQLLGLQTLDAGTTLTVVPGDGLTGDGVLTLSDPATNKNAKQGRYVLMITEAAADGGKFEVEGPDGKSIGIGDVGTLFNKEIKFTLADGATDFVEGDLIYIDVDSNPATGEQFVPWDPDGADGAERAVAMSLYLISTGAGQTARVAGITRLAELNGKVIEWPDGVTEAQKSAAADSLAKQMIIVR
ncbi:head decoration protein [Maritalea porphyrae]|uniref:head decoration protein n=1 Tax=Maritalea porphyrae TaxID=880732 RepID=UPI0022B07872|nr:head decoration protein [Maritalea porphyrae]MCZ4270724.1 head decoration protein [Maritalea porphyrae]